MKKRKTFDEWIKEIEKHLTSGGRLNHKHRQWLRIQKMYLITKGKGLSKDKIKALDGLNTLIGHDWKGKPKYNTRFPIFKEKDTLTTNHSYKTEEKRTITPPVVPLNTNFKGEHPFRKKQTKLYDLIHYELFYTQLIMIPNPKVLYKIELAKKRYGNEWDQKVDSYLEYLNENSNKLREFVRLWFWQNQRQYKLLPLDLVLGYKKKGTLNLLIREDAGISSNGIFIIYALILHLHYSWNS